MGFGGVLGGPGGGWGVWGWGLWVIGMGVLGLDGIVVYRDGGSWLGWGCGIWRWGLWVGVGCGIWGWGLWVGVGLWDVAMGVLGWGDVRRWVSGGHREPVGFLVGKYPTPVGAAGQGVPRGLRVWVGEQRRLRGGVTDGRGGVRWRCRRRCGRWCWCPPRSWGCRWCRACAAWPPSAPATCAWPMSAPTATSAPRSESVFPSPPPPPCPTSVGRPRVSLCVRLAGRC